MESVVKLLKNKYAPFFFAVPLFFISYRYSGIVMDAILYITQYVYSIDPARFVGDPTFDYGNQDSLGFFSPILGLFVKPLGVNLGMMVYTLVAQILWIIAAVFMLKSLMRLTHNRLWILPITILFVFCFSNAMPIGRIRFFHFVECYACSRSLSIVAGIAALAALFSNKRWMSLAFILFGTVVHPLTAGWCLPLWFFYFFPKTRWPIAIFSLLFPLTFLLHTGPLDIFPEDWLSKPLGFELTYSIAGKYVALLMFFCFVVKKFSRNECVRKLSISAFLTIAIAMYWDCWAGYSGHIFLYQVQPWRVVWLGAVIAVPLFLCFLKDSLRQILKRSNVLFSDMILFLFGMNMIAPHNFILVSLLPVLLCKKNMGLKQIKEKHFVAVFALWVILGLFVQQYHIWCLQGFKPLFWYNFATLSLMRDGIFFGTFCFCVAFAIRCACKRNLVVPAVLVIYCVFPHFQLIPLLAIFLMAFPKNDKMKYLGLASLILLVILVDGSLNSDGRLHKLLNGYPLNTVKYLFLFALCVAVVWIRKISRVPMIVLLLVCTGISVATYDKRDLKMKETEMGLDDFVEESVFPQIDNRGRILFFVKDSYTFEPQLQFLTGAYIANSMKVGRIFSEKHSKEYSRRCTLFNVGRKLAKEEKMSGDINQTLLSNPDTLVSRAEFLCREKEILHFVSNLSTVPLEKRDSTDLRNGTRVFLYACP